MYIFKVESALYQSENVLSSAESNQVACRSAGGVWLVVTRIPCRGACPLFVTVAAGNGMQISPLSVSAII